MIGSRRSVVRRRGQLASKLMLGCVFGLVGVAGQRQAAAGTTEQLRSAVRTRLSHSPLPRTVRKLRADSLRVTERQKSIEPGAGSSGADRAKRSAAKFMGNLVSEVIKRAEKSPGNQRLRKAVKDSLESQLGDSDLKAMLKEGSYGALTSKLEIAIGVAEQVARKHEGSRPVDSRSGAAPPTKTDAMGLALGHLAGRWQIAPVLESTWPLLALAVPTLRAEAKLTDNRRAYWEQMVSLARQQEMSEDEIRGIGERNDLAQVLEDESRFHNWLRESSRTAKDVTAAALYSIHQLGLDATTQEGREAWPGLVNKYWVDRVFALTKAVEHKLYPDGQGQPATAQFFAPTYAIVRAYGTTRAAQTGGSGDGHAQMLADANLTLEAKDLARLTRDPKLLQHLEEAEEQLGTVLQGLYATFADPFGAGRPSREDILNAVVDALNLHAR